MVPYPRVSLSCGDRPLFVEHGVAGTFGCFIRAYLRATFFPPGMHRDAYPERQRDWPYEALATVRWETIG